LLLCDAPDGSTALSSGSEAAPPRERVRENAQRQRQHRHRRHHGRDDDRRPRQAAARRRGGLRLARACAQGGACMSATRPAEGQRAASRLLFVTSA